MTSNEILKADVLDILFDNRNKQYGAYTLRKNYNKRLSLALGISLSSVLLIFFFINGDVSTHQIVQEKPDVVVRTFEIPEVPKIPDPPLQKPQPIQQVRQQSFTSQIEIVKDINAKNLLADQETLLTSAISNITLRGNPTIGNPVINIPGTPGANINHQITKTNVKPDQEPEFPGGQDAWIKFLRKNLVAPSELEVDEKKMVVVRFLVAEDGSVTGFEVSQSAGRSFDNEVIRVLKKMPKWKPAIQNGEAVARAYMQPVTFVGVEQ